MGIGQIYFNLRGRESQGIVSPGAEAKALADELSAKLLTMTDPEDGTRIIRAVYQRDDFQVKGIVGFRTVKTFSTRDVDASAAPTIDTAALNGTHQVSAEINASPITSAYMLEARTHAAFSLESPTILGNRFGRMSSSRIRQMPTMAWPSCSFG